MIEISNDIQMLINTGAIFYISHSAGKDSQAMYAEVSKVVPYDQIVVVHADLGHVEWQGVQQHIKNNIQHHLNVVRAVKRDGTIKSFFSMVRDRKKFPSSSCRQCTSDLKRDPIMKFIRHDLKAKGVTLAINCTGIRAEESTSRALKNPFEINKRESNSKRTLYNWMPIFEKTKEEVFASIAEAAQKPFWAYEKNERLSCVLCIMGSMNDLQHGAYQNPALYEEYVNLEKEIGHTMFFTKGKPTPLEEHLKLTVEENYARSAS